MRIKDRSRNTVRPRLRHRIADPVTPGIHGEAGGIDLRIANGSRRKEAKRDSAGRSAVVVLDRPGTGVAATLFGGIAHFVAGDGDRGRRIDAARGARQAAIHHGEGKHEILRLLETPARLLVVALLALRRQRVKQAAEQQDHDREHDRELDQRETILVLAHQLVSITDM